MFSLVSQSLLASVYRKDGGVVMHLSLRLPRAPLLILTLSTCPTSVVTLSASPAVMQTNRTFQRCIIDPLSFVVALAKQNDAGDNKYKCDLFVWMSPLMSSPNDRQERSHILMVPLEMQLFSSGSSSSCSNKRPLGIKTHFREINFLLGPHSKAAF